MSILAPFFLRTVMYGIVVGLSCELCSGRWWGSAITCFSYPACHATFACLSSRPVLVSFEWVENSVPPIVEVEDRHVEYKHWIVHPPMAAETSSPSVHQVSQD